MNMKVKASERTKRLRSPIRDLVAIADRLRQKGKKIYPFNIGDPNKFDFDTPEHLKRALFEAVKKGAGYYSASEGDSKLIDAIVKKENETRNINLAQEDVLITEGISEGIHFLANALIEPRRGDEILLPGPSYPVYPEMTKFASGVPITYKLDEENGWQVDLDNLRSRISEKTRLLVIINPNNPTGTVLSKKIVQGIIDVAGEYDLPVASDEIYDRFVFGNTRFVGTASLANDVPVIGLNGFSKVYLAPGWRCGYMYFHDPEEKLTEIKEAVIAEARQRLSACTPIMKACALAFNDDSYLPEVVRKLKERAEFAHKKLNNIDGISAVKPEGAFYIFPRVELGNKWRSDEDFVIDVLNNTGLVIPYGSGFCPEFGKSHFRSVILPPIELMDEAFTKLEEFMWHNA